MVVLRYFPEDADQQTRGILARYSDLRYKAMAARQRGAKALVVVTGPAVAERRADRADGVRLGARRIRHHRHQRQRRRRRRALRRRQAAGGRAEGSRYRQPARRRLRAARRGDDGQGRGDARKADRPQRRRLPAGHRAGDRRGQAVGGGRRPLRSPGAQRAQRVARGARRRRARPPRRRRQRLGLGRGAGDRRRAGEAADAAAPPARRVLERRGDRPARVGGVPRHAAGAGRSSWPRISTSTWSAACRTTSSWCRRPAAARRGPRFSSGPTSPPDSTSPVQPDPFQPHRRDELQSGRRAEPVVHDRRAHRLPQAVGHRRQDRLRGPRSRGRLRRRHRAAADGARPGAGVRQGRAVGADGVAHGRADLHRHRARLRRRR